MEPSDSAKSAAGTRSPSLSTLELRKLRIAIAADSPRHRHFLQQALEDRGLKVVLCDGLTPDFPERLEAGEVDVLLLDMHDDAEVDEAVFDRLLEEEKVPIVFSDVTALTVNEPRTLARWHNTLVRKIAEITGRAEGLEDSAETHISELASRSGLFKLNGERTPAPAAQGEVAMNVWVLGASLGGPEAVKRFLRALPPDLPVAFVLAQHLGANFVKLLADQLDRAASFQVLQPTVGHVLRHGQVVIAPVEERLVVNSVGTLELRALAERSAYSPSIDLVIRDVAQRYPGRSGAILFSGMGDDGCRGAREMVQRGGLVWAQDARSCVMSSMPDRAREAGVVEYSGTPEQLAKRLIRHFSQMK